MNSNESISPLSHIIIKGAAEHNLKNIDINIPKNKLVVFTGVSGSGKSSLAFGTVYQEGMRRYTESMSSYIRQFLDANNKPKFDSIDGLSPTIAIEQKTAGTSQRSTVGTMTEINDYLRILFARIGVPHSPKTNLPIRSFTPSQICNKICSLPIGSKIRITSPVYIGQIGNPSSLLISLKKKGFERFKINGELVDCSEELPDFEHHKPYDISAVIDRVIIKEGISSRINDSVELSLKLSDGLVLVDVVELAGGSDNFSLGDGFFAKNGGSLLFSEKFSCPESGFSIAELSSRMFSFNSPYGACPSCDGIGTQVFVDPELIVQDKTLSLKNGAIHPWFIHNHKYYLQILAGLANHFKFSIDVPYFELSDEVKNIIMYGTKDKKVEMKITTYGDEYNILNKPFDGVVADILNRIKQEDSEDDLSIYQVIDKCSACKGYRLKQDSLLVRINEKHIGEICEMYISDLIEWFEKLPKFLSENDAKIAEKAVDEILSRLNFIKNVGLGYLKLSRKSNTLSGGEAQRTRLASQIGSGLTGVIYVFDEPSIGLHVADTMKLVNTLLQLRDKGNSVLVVEHDDETIKAADWIIDVGPGAGKYGGQIISQGTLQQIIKDPNSVTGKVFSGEMAIEVPAQRRKFFGQNAMAVKLTNARSYNLKNVTLEIPLQKFIVVTGVSGSGKSTLINGTLVPALNGNIKGVKISNCGLYDDLIGSDYIDKVISIDQSPIGRTPRSNAATYTDAFSFIRELFTELPASRARGYKSGRFSFNVKGGRCEKCQGDGVIKVEMQLLSDVYILCSVCEGKRYNDETLEVKYNGHSIIDVLNMNSLEAFKLFKNIPQIADKLKTLIDVGLGYLTLGQPATTISGGEAQRIKLARELARRSTDRTIYIMDEPTTGLHTIDVMHLLNVINRLVDNGSTVLVIEHDMDLIKSADWVIDVGPYGGEQGGEIVCAGTPEDIVLCERSLTGQYLKKVLKS